MHNIYDCINAYNFRDNVIGFAVSYHLFRSIYHSKICHRNTQLLDKINRTSKKCIVYEYLTGPLSKNVQ